VNVIRRALCLALVVTLALQTPTNAHETLRWGFGRMPTSRVVTGACVSSAQIWVQEVGMSGINRLRVKFERRGPYDPGFPGLTYASSGWMYSRAFPDDSLSYYVYFSWAFRYPAGGRYQMRSVMIGERPSFWQPDRKITGRVGDIGCDFMPGEA
jgi:hypothetical protein